MKAAKKKRRNPGGRLATGTAEWLPNRTGGGQYVCRFPSAGGASRERRKMLGDDGRPLFTDQEGDYEAAHDEAHRYYKFLIRKEALDVVIERKKSKLPAPTTVEGFGEQWTSGALLLRFGKVARLKIKKSAKDDRNRLRSYVYPYIGKMQMRDVGKKDIGGVFIKADLAFRKRNGYDMSPGTRRQLYTVMHRLFELAIDPAELIETNPVTKAFLPEKGPSKQYAFLYPDELIELCKCTEIPVARRLYYVIATYTGLRKGSLRALIWRNVDIKRGVMRSLVSKTEEHIGPQLFQMSDPDLPGLRSAIELIARYRKYVAKRIGEPSDNAPVIRQEDLELVRKDTEASTLRMDLDMAKITRPELFAESAKEVPLRFHDLRATFVTWAHRAGKGEGWIGDRTGHITKAIMLRYIRAARNMGDLDIEPFPDLTKAIPELANLTA